MVASEQARKIWQMAVGLLAKREHSRHELVVKLKRHQFDEALVNQVVERLCAKGLLSEQRFVEAYITSRANRGFGPRRIQWELEERRVPIESVKLYLDENDPIWIDRALQARAKKFGSGLPRDFQQQTKQIRFLNYRGFSQSQIQQAFDNLTDNVQND